MACLPWTDTNATYNTTEEKLATWNGTEYVQQECDILCVSGYSLENWVCERITQEKIEELIDINTGTTATVSWTTTPIDMDNIELINIGDDILTGAVDKVILQQSSNPADVPEWSENALETILTQDLVQELSWSTDKKAEVHWVLDLQFISVPTNGLAVPINEVIRFNNPIKVRVHVGNKSVKFKVRHNWSTGYNFDLLTINPSADCSNLTAVDLYTGTLRDPDGSWYANIWTCGASSFVAYTEEDISQNQWSNGWNSWWNSGWSSSASSTTDNIEETDTDTSAINPELTDIDNQEWYDNNWDQKEILDNGLSREMNNAYQFAFRAWITTMKSIEEANMEWTLDRIAMAKMLSQYAINVLWKTPDTSKKCEFADVTADLDARYSSGVTLACQLGIMWVGITDFRPSDNVIRAEFATALSRLLFWLSDGTDAYYTTHLAKLKAEWIISNDDPTLEELRGYVMLMLMRSAK